MAARVLHGVSSRVLQSMEGRVLQGMRCRSWQGPAHLDVSLGVLEGGGASEDQQDGVGPPGHQALGIMHRLPQQLILLQVVQLLGPLQAQDCALCLQASVLCVGNGNP